MPRARSSSGPRPRRGPRSTRPARAATTSPPPSGRPPCPARPTPRTSRPPAPARSCRSPAARARRGRRRGTAGRTPTRSSSLGRGRVVGEPRGDLGRPDELAPLVEGADLHDVEHEPPSPGRRAPTPARRASATTSSSSSLPWLIACSPMARLVRARRRVSPPSGSRRGRRGSARPVGRGGSASRWRARRIGVGAGPAPRDGGVERAAGGLEVERQPLRRRAVAPVIASATVACRAVRSALQQRLVGRLGDQLAGEPVAAVVEAQHAGIDHRRDRRGRRRRASPPSDEVDLALRRTTARGRPAAGPARAPGPSRSSADISEP